MEEWKIEKLLRGQRSTREVFWVATRSYKPKFWLVELYKQKTDVKQVKIPMELIENAKFEGKFEIIFDGLSCLILKFHLSDCCHLKTKKTAESLLTWRFECIPILSSSSSELRTSVQESNVNFVSIPNCWMTRPQTYKWTNMIDRFVTLLV